MFFSFTIGGIASVFSANFLGIPESTSIVVVTKKKISSKNAISAIEPALISGFSLLAIITYDLTIPFNKSHTKNTLAIAPKTIVNLIPVPTHLEISPAGANILLSAPITSPFEAIK